MMLLILLTFTCVVLSLYITLLAAAVKGSIVVYAHLSLRTSIRVVTLVNVVLTPRPRPPRLTDTARVWITALSVSVAIALQEAVRTICKWWAWNARALIFVKMKTAVAGTGKSTYSIVAGLGTGACMVLTLVVVNAAFVVRGVQVIASMTKTLSRE